MTGSLSADWCRQLDERLLGARAEVHGCRKLAVKMGWPPAYRRWWSVARSAAVAQATDRATDLGHLPLPFGSWLPSPWIQCPGPYTGWRASCTLGLPGLEQPDKSAVTPSQVRPARHPSILDWQAPWKCRGMVATVLAACSVLIPVEARNSRWLTARRHSWRLAIVRAPNVMFPSA